MEMEKVWYQEGYNHSHFGFLRVVHGSGCGFLLFDKKRLSLSILREFHSKLRIQQQLVPSFYPSRVPSLFRGILAIRKLSSPKPLKL